MIIFRKSYYQKKISGFSIFFNRFSANGKKETNVFSTHSIDEAKRRNAINYLKKESAITK